MTLPGFPQRRGRPLIKHDRPEADEFIDLEHVWTMIRRQAKVLVIAAAIGVLLGIVYLRFTPPTYSARAEILVDRNISRVVGERSNVETAMETDEAISTLVVVLKSFRLAADVVQAENLDSDPVFTDRPSSISSTVLQPLRVAAGYLKGSADPAETTGAVAADAAANARVRKAAAVLRGDLAVDRIGRSQVISLSYQSHDPVLAQRVVEAYTEAFLSEQLAANRIASGQAAEWMQTRLAELREEQREAALEVERFRAENGLTVAQGELVSEQQLSQLTGQLVLAQSQLAEAQARSRQIDAMIAAGPAQAAQSAGDTTDPVVTELRTRYAAVTERLDQITTNFGADHPQAQILRAEQQEIAGQLFRELERLAAVYRGELEVAQNRYEALSGTISEQSGTNATSNQSLVRLRELEQRSETLNALYASLLARYEEMVQKQSFPVSNMRVISAATVPEQPDGPRFSSTMAMALALGLFAGVVVGALNEFNERFFRTGGDIQRELGLRFLGYIPLVKTGLFGKLFKSRQDTTALPMDDALVTSFDETLRNTRIAIDFALGDRRSKVIGVVSAVPGEGKSTFALNFAELLAVSGCNTILIDADMRNPGLSRAFVPDSSSGLVEAVDDRSWHDHAVVLDDRCALVFLPTLASRNYRHGSALLSSAGMGELLDSLRQQFDYVIVDLPPSGPVVDAKAFQPLADAFVLVVQWGSTPRELVRSILDADPELAAKVVGAVLNKTDMDALTKYSDRGSTERAMKSYRSYFTQQ